MLQVTTFSITKSMMILSGIAGVVSVEIHSQLSSDMNPIRKRIWVIGHRGGNMNRKIEIYAEPSKTTVIVDDVVVKGLQKIKIEQEVGQEIPSVEMKCISHDLNLSFERADIKFVFDNNWVDCSKLLPDLEEPVLALVVDKYGYHQEVLTLKHFEESDALYEGDYWCSYRTINIESLGMCKVIAWQGLPTVDGYMRGNDKAT